MAKMMEGDKIYQDFTHSQRTVDVSPGKLEEIAKIDCVQGFIDEMQSVVSKGSPENYGFDDGMLSVINSPRDGDIRDEVKKVAENIREDVKDIQYIIHCGIGGSELGASTGISAAGNSDAEYIPITSLNNDHIARILDRIDPEKTVLIKATRSNTTKETLTAFNVFALALEDKIGDSYRGHCVAVIGKDKRKEATDNGYQFVPVEGMMSGRYTGLHAANLFTMDLMGVDIDQLHEGARHMLKRCTEGRTIEDNPALEVAVYTFLMNTEKGKTVLNTGVFSPKLIKYGDLLGQLYEESLGHRGDISLTTKTSELSNKSHSYFQGWLEGANVTYHQMVFPIKNNEREVMADPQTGETLRDIEFAAYKGIVNALANAGRPSYTTFLDSVNENPLGQIMMRDQIATIILGELFGLRKEFIGGEKTDFGYFNQPGVEAYKILMKNELKNLKGLHQELKYMESNFT